VAQLERVDAVVIGAGVVGLAVARWLALKGFETLILEAETGYGAGVSSRNSEVIHAGIYYPDGSLKAALCVEGRRRLYDYCASRRIPHRRTEKLVFAAHDGQLEALEVILASALAAGVTDLQPLTGRQAAALEPALTCAGALLSPSTGIVDSHALMTALLADAESGGAVLVAKTKVDRVTRARGDWLIHVRDHGPVVCARRVVNAAGLGAQALAVAVEGLEARRVPPLHLARGVYFTYAGRLPFSRLIYPTPEAGGLGTHLTLDLAGQARFGPDVEWITDIDFTVAPARRTAFAAAAQRIWPDLQPDRLQPGYAGIRPKLSGPGQPVADFMISGPADHGLEGLVNLFGIESPGLTASLAIAERVGALLTTSSCEAAS
jgi:L-2-hydroxyglutarate oxidase LhgO